jgi:6-phosphogluconolactonase
MLRGANKRRQWREIRKGKLMSAVNSSFWVYSGNYGTSEPRGIQLLRYEPLKASLTPAGLAAPADEATFVVIHPNGRYLYAVTAARIDPAYPGAVEAFAIDRQSGRLTLLNRRASGGATPAHLAVDPTGKLLIAANYTGGSVAAFPIADDGQLGEASAIVQHHGSSINPKRQREPHPHQVAFDPSGRNVLVPDLGMDKILKYRVDVVEGTLSAAGAAVVPAGSGPRHVTFSADARFMYVINELTCTLSAISYDLRIGEGGGAMREIQTIQVWPEKEGASGAEIELHPGGQFLYASNRGVDSIAICEIDHASGKLRLAGTCPTGGRTPRHFGIDPTGRYIFASNMDSNSVVLLSIEAAGERLTPGNVHATTEAPCCTAFLPMIQPT